MRPNATRGGPVRVGRSTVLVTGGLGYIGSHAVPELLDRGWRVRILDNRYRCDADAADALCAMPGVDLVEGDVRYPHAVDRAVQGVEAVVHLAAVCINKSIADPAESLDVNLMGTQHLLDSVSRHGVRRVVFASSASVYGNATQLPMREDGPVDPLTPYCTAKLAGEQLLAFHAQRSALTWLALRFFNVYGPGQPTDAFYTSVILTFVKRLLAGQPPVIDGRGDQSMDFVHVADVARAIGLALDSDASGESLNVGTGRQTTVAELAERLVVAMGADVVPQFRPREVLVARREASVERIAEVLGWRPRVEIDEGLASVLDWIKQHRA
ncbi:NAD-dependent epimerase/dehydratase family protein [Nocardioides sp. HDW12B]|uniref:NAD-dependent epimerase/dehydratase family protein n=1 Tax=Nocardioides sp. HDW12B TaxID=2714939 RepID=UPI00140848B9|nr:NAD-dependent epimerase/dehydratase family protein [Nocardioides sp. HDW12B]QIK66064.1 NAD-dependent epimerase/dehydratase family protein [Nocardioides sp. HDW12B]